MVGTIPKIPLCSGGTVCIVGHRHKYATMNPFNYKNGFQNVPNFFWFLTVIGPKLIYSPELSRRDSIFLKLFFVWYFGIWGLYLPKLSEKTLFCTVDRDIHTECSKQFKWNLYFYGSGQSGPFRAGLKLL